MDRKYLWLIAWTGIIWGGLMIAAIQLWKKTGPVADALGSMVALVWTVLAATSPWLIASIRGVPRRMRASTFMRRRLFIFGLVLDAIEEDRHSPETIWDGRSNIRRDPYFTMNGSLIFFGGVVCNLLGLWFFCGGGDYTIACNVNTTMKSATSGPQDFVDSTMVGMQSLARMPQELVEDFQRQQTAKEKADRFAKALLADGIDSDETRRTAESAAKSEPNCLKLADAMTKLLPSTQYSVTSTATDRLEITNLSNQQTMQINATAQGPTVSDSATENRKSELAAQAKKEQDKDRAADLSKPVLEFGPTSPQAIKAVRAANLDLINLPVLSEQLAAGGCQLEHHFGNCYFIRKGDAAQRLAIRNTRVQVEDVSQLNEIADKLAVPICKNGVTGEKAVDVAQHSDWNQLIRALDLLESKLKGQCKIVYEQRSGIVQILSKKTPTESMLVLLKREGPEQKIESVDVKTQ